MTTITLVTNDQALSVVLKPLVASGDYNLVRVKVEFDSAWEKYHSRSAVFRTMKGAEAETLLVDDECVIPHEVLAEAGTLFIAIRGVTLDGKIIKTTEEVKYKVVQGAKDIASTTAPSHDMYAQYMAAIAAGIAPHIEAMNDRADAKLEEIEADADAACKKYDDLAGSYIRMKVGSYEGEGKFGADNPNTLEFDFDVKMVIVYDPSNTELTTSNTQARQDFLVGGSGFTAPLASTYGGRVKYSMSGKTLTWYADYYDLNGNECSRFTPAAQMNTEGTTYYYIAIGV